MKMKYLFVVLGILIPLVYGDGEIAMANSDPAVAVVNGRIQPAPQQRCQKGEVYTECGGNRCTEPQCNPPSEPKMCPMFCKPGCTCAKDRVRDGATGKCVYRKDCTTAVCPLGEEYRECGSACPPTCNNPNPKVCTMQCVQGCFCPNGKYRNNDGVCVNLENCPSN